MIKKYLDKIGETNDVEKMRELGDMLVETLYDVKEYNHNKYEDYKMKLYTMAYGNVLTDEMKMEWVSQLDPGKRVTVP